MQAGIIKLMKIWGLMTQGDWGPLTCYTSRRKRLVWYKKAPPKKPYSADQLLLQQRFSDAAAAWRAMPLDQRDRWKIACKRAHLRIGGPALHTYYHMKADPAIIHTIERQTGLALL